jgi:cytochrome c peroxidase
MIGFRCAGIVAGSFLVALVTVPTVAWSQEEEERAPTASELRVLLRDRIDDLDLLRVPLANEELPQPRLENGEIDPLYAITEEKRYLGKLLFHDPVRSNNIQPKFGGSTATSQTASCGSCHFGEAGSKAGQVQAVGVGGEGRMEMDAEGHFLLTRRIADGMTDTLPTPMEVKDETGQVVVSGKFDMVDAPGRLAPSVVGFAYNNRLFWDGAAGEPFDPDDPSKPNLNALGLPTGENLAQATTEGHRMAGTQQFALQKNPIYTELFAAAFPAEFARSLETGNPDDLINDNTIQRALATYMRTVVTRDSPWDRFLAGNDAALSLHERLGAWVFAAPVEQGGADCISCHSGPALNKQLGDEEGLLVEENFHNLGLNDHPLQDLARETLADPSHRDGGRAGVIGDATAIFKFKTPTVRQLQGGRRFMHSGELDGLRAVVDYFNEGLPAGTDAAAAASLSAFFTHPRGGDEPGLALSERKLSALEDFLRDGLFDPSFVHYDADSPTDTFDPNASDLTYNEELKALGALDGMLPSGMAVGNDDSVSRSQTVFVRGRVNLGVVIDLSDTVYLLNYLFAGGDQPVPLVAADVNSDDFIDLSDPIYLLQFLFLGGPQPGMPFPTEGQLVR